MRPCGLEGAWEEGRGGDEIILEALLLETLALHLLFYCMGEKLTSVIASPLVCGA